MSRIFWLALLLFSITIHAQTPSPAPVPPLDPLLLAPDLWQKPPDSFGQLLHDGQFAWTSAMKDTLRSVAPSLRFGDSPVPEALLRLRDGKFSSASILLFSHGTGGDIGETDFNALLAKVRQNLTSLTGATETPLGTNSSSAVHAEGASWTTAASQFLLEWSVTRGSKVQMIPFRAEFIRLTVSPRITTPRPIGQDAPKNAALEAIRHFSGPSHVTRDLAGGDVVLKDVPMVDQGDKGYCVVASVERVMRYYGVDVDQDELAQMARSDAEAGTSVSSMKNSLNRLTGRLRVKVRTLYDWDIREFLSIMNDYNRAAKRTRQREVNLGGNVIDVDDCMSRLDPALYKEVRLKKVADYGRFQRDIQRSIDDGIPLLWSVRIGLIPDKRLPQAVGNHMRLIIGYNTKTNELIYTDSWGPGFEEERMPMDDAWTITMGLNSLQPAGT